MIIYCLSPISWVMNSEQLAWRVLVQVPDGVAAKCCDPLNTNQGWQVGAVCG